MNCKLRKAQRVWVLRSIVTDRQTCTSTIMNDSPILHYLQRDREFSCPVDTVWSCKRNCNRIQDSRIIQKSVTRWEHVRSHSGEAQRDFRQEIVSHNVHTFSQNHLQLIRTVRSQASSRGIREGESTARTLFCPSGCDLSELFHQCCIFNYSSITDAIQSQ